MTDHVYPRPAQTISRDRHGGGKLMKKLLYAVASLAIMLAPAQAETKYRFAVVPKAMNNPFFDVARDG